MKKKIIFLMLSLLIVCCNKNSSSRFKKELSNSKSFSTNQIVNIEGIIEKFKTGAYDPIRSKIISQTYKETDKERDESYKKEPMEINDEYDKAGPGVEKIMSIIGYEKNEEEVNTIYYALERIEEVKNNPEEAIIATDNALSKINAQLVENKLAEGEDKLSKFISEKEEDEYDLELLKEMDYSHDAVTVIGLGENGVEGATGLTASLVEVRNDLRTFKANLN